MASRRIPPTPQQKQATLPPTRARDLLNRQIEAARGLLAQPQVERLDHETWEQTTRAIVAGAFGEPSEAVARFECARPGYAARIGQDEQFWTQYRRDKLQTEIVCVSSCVTQLELGLGPGVDARPETGDPSADVRELENIATLVESEEVREIVVRDVAELKSALRHGMAKCALLLGGSILEAVLVDVLDRNRALASSYLKKRRFPDEASLPDLIAIAGDPTLLESPRHLLTPTSAAVARAVTDHRDLIHPHAEARGRIRVDETTAQAIVHLLSLVVRDLLEATERGDVAAYVNK